jgi:hypothetical protein
MKNYKVKATVNFPDKTTHQRRTLGEEFICAEERYNELKFKNVIELVEIIEENEEIDTMDEVVDKPVEEIVEKKSRKRRTSKKEN